MKAVNLTEFKECMIGELIQQGLEPKNARSLVERSLSNVNDPDVPCKPQFGWLYFGADGYTHWTSTRPSSVDDPGETATVATKWEKFFFNRFENSSEKMMQALAVML